MRRVPPSLLHAARDVAAILVLGLVSGTFLALWGMHVENRWWATIGVDPRTSWTDAVAVAGRWLRMLAAFVLVVWCASRARAGTRSRWLPAWLALGLVAAGTALAAVTLPDGRHLVDTWPGPDFPFVPGTDGLWVLGLSPAWSYPVLTGALLVAAATLGVRGGRGADDRASTRLATVPPGGSLLTGAMVGIPAVAATAGAALAILGVSSRFQQESAIDWAFAAGTLWLLVEGLVAAALVSGAGPLGLVGAALAALPCVLTPVRSWLVGGDDLLLVQAAASLLACAVVVAWRPCATWAAGALGTAEPPRTASAVPDPLG